MGCATWFRVVIIVVALTKGAEANPEIVLAVIIRLEAAVAERRHMAYRVNGPGEIIQHQDWDIERPEQTGPAEREIEKRSHPKMWQHIKIRTFPEPAVPNFPDISGITKRLISEARRLAHQPHYMRVRKSMERTMNVLIGIRLQMVITVIPYPRHRITRKRDSRTCSKDEFQPAGHFKSPMGQISV